MSGTATPELAQERLEAGPGSSKTCEMALMERDWAVCGEPAVIRRVVRCWMCHCSDPLWLCIRCYEGRWLPRDGLLTCWKCAGL